jgi:HD-like signal output (HDOD) protein
MENHRLQLEYLLTDTIAALPPLEKTVAELIEWYAAPRADIGELIKIAGADSALTTELIRLANSQCFTRHEAKVPYTSLKSAIERLGADATMAFVASRSTRQTLCRDRISDARWHEYLKHSTEISLACRVLAEELGLNAAECRSYDAVGLIHDVGRMVMIASSCSADMPLLGTSYDQMLSILEHEEDAMGMNHCVVAERLFRRWHLPDFLCHAVMRHHTPFVGDDFSFSGALIFVAHFVSMSDFTGDILALVLEPELLAAMGTDLATVERAQAAYQQA